MNNTNIELIESLSNNLARSHELGASMRTSALSRLVWFVGIAGYVMINARPYWDAIRGSQLASFQIVWLSLPWVITAISAILTHYFIDEAAVKDNKYYEAKREALDLHKIEIKSAKSDFDEFRAILRDTDPEIKTLKDNCDTWFRIASRFEKLTFTMLTLSFIWTLVGPLIV